jgi:hypothetical protein
MKTIQLNVEVSEEIGRRIKKDAVEMGVSLAAYAAVAYENFLSKPIASRRVYFDRKKHGKRMGRKIAA